jgi:hypothetical protein
MTRSHSALEVPCDDCAAPTPTTHCPGPVAHAFHKALLAIPLPPQKLAELLRLPPDELTSMPAFNLIYELQKLSVNEFRHIARLAGHTLQDAVVATVTGPRSLPEDADARARLTAALTDAGGQGCHPSELATRFRWSLDAVHTVAEQIHTEPQPGTRLHSTPTGRLVLAADSVYLTPPPPSAPPARKQRPKSVDEEPFSLTWKLAYNLRRLLVDGNTDISQSDREELTSHDLVTNDWPHVPIDLKYSIQWFS